MKNLFYLIILFFIFSCKSVGQKPNSIENIEHMLSELSWNSFSVIMNYSTDIKFDENSNNIIEIGKPISQGLLNNITNPDKAVVIHLILTKIWEPEIFQLRTYVPCNQKDSEIIEFMINNLAWSENENNGNNSVDPDDIKIMTSYWQARIR